MFFLLSVEEQLKINILRTIVYVINQQTITYLNDFKDGILNLLNCILFDFVINL